MSIDPVYETKMRHKHCIAEIGRLQKALEIFAQHANDYEDRPDQINYAKDEYRVSITVTVGDLRRARTVLVSSPADQSHERGVRDQLIAEAVKALKLTAVELENLFAMVQGEVPSLLEDHHSYSEIVEALKIANATLAKLKGLDQAQHPANVPDGWQLVPKDRIAIQRWWLENVLSSLDGPLPSGRIGDSVFLLREMISDLLAAAPNPTRTEG